MIKEGAYMYVHVYMYYVHVYIHVYTCIYIYCCQKLRTYNRIYNYSRANILYSRERTVNFLYIQLSASKIHVYIFSRILQIKISDSGRIFVKKEKEILAWLLTPAAWCCVLVDWTAFWQSWTQWSPKSAFVQLLSPRDSFRSRWSPVVPWKNTNRSPSHCTLRRKF